MTKLTKICSALVVSFAAYIAGASSSEAFTLNLNWTGNGTVVPTDIYSLTGTVTGADSVITPDGFIRSRDGEISNFTLNFFKNGTPLPSASYDFTAISGDGFYNFNYQIAGNMILQTGALGDLDGFSIGDSVSGYSLDSLNGTGLSFNDFTGGVDFASGSALTATPVPFEFEGSAGILTLGAIWGVNKWRKNRLKK